MKKYISGLMMAAFLGFASVASAHVVVRPNQAGIGSFQTFTMGVPTEKEVPTIAVRLLIPAGLNEVSPTVKPGWTINVKKSGMGDDAVITEIDWTGGSIPVGERDDFTFSAQVPATSTTLQWKAYQTYADGSIVSWDQLPQSSAASAVDMGPYSQTAVIDDLTATSTQSNTSVNNDAVIISLTSLILSLLAIGTARKNKKA